MSQVQLSTQRRSKIEQFKKQVLSFGFRFYLLAKLPMAWMAGVRIRKLTDETAQVSVPYRWLNQNPFRSTYFAVLSMAGEMATGVLGLMYLRSAGAPMSILVVDLKAQFTKKATNVTTFTCNDGAKFHHTVEEALITGEGVEIKTESIGTDKNGVEVARFWVTWSVKKKNT